MLSITEGKINSYLKIEADEVETYVEPINAEHSCPLCQSTELVRNGSYFRNIIYLKEGRICIKRMRMQRYKCNCCGKTRSHYPKFMVPRREYSLGALLFMGLTKARALMMRFMNTRASGVYRERNWMRCSDMNLKEPLMPQVVLASNADCTRFQENALALSAHTHLIRRI